MKDTFTIRITEKDRLAAGPFGDNYNCIICTALKRRGIGKQHNEGVDRTIIDGVQYDHKELGIRELHVEEGHKTYAPAVVGTRITFTRRVAC